MSVATVRSQPSYESKRRRIHTFGYYRKCANELELTSANTENFEANTAIKKGYTAFKTFPVAVRFEERMKNADGNLHSKIETWKAWRAEGRAEANEENQATFMNSIAHQWARNAPVKEERVEAF